MTDWVRAFDGADVVSFDIYDTLVVRPFMRPSDLFLYIEKKEDSAGFRDARVSAERRARRVIDAEAGLDEIYSVIDGRFRHLKDAETSAEISLSLPNERMTCAFRTAKAIGKMVVLATDMYLPRDIIVRVLDHCGIEGYDRLYISSELRCNKRSGGLFDAILDDMSVPPERMVHIGDDPRSDRDMPKSKGIRTVFVGKRSAEYLRGSPYVRRFLSRNGLSGSVIAAADLLLSDKVEGRDDWYAMGYRYGGPLTKAYAEHLLKEIPKGSKVFFVARDGYNLHRLFRDQYGYDAEYVPGQRLLYYVISDERMPFGRYELPPKFAQRFGYALTVRNARYLLSFFSRGLGIEDLPESDRETVSMYNERCAEIDAMRREVLRWYSELVRVDDGREVHIVDCTTMRFSSQKLVELALGRKVKGHYFVCLSDDDGLDYEGFGSRAAPVAGWMRINIPEFFFCIPEGPLVGWDENGPVSSVEGTEIAKNRMSMSEGVIDYCMDAAHLVPDAGVTYRSAVEWSMTLADRANPYYGAISKVGWSDVPDHNGSHHLIVTSRDLPFLARKLLTEAVNKANGR